MHLALTPVAPFDFSLSLAFLQGFGPMSGEQHVTATSLTKAVMHHGQAIAFRVEQIPDGTLRCRLFAREPIKPDTQAAVADRIAFFLSANDDLSPFEQLATKDRAFATVWPRLRGLHHVKFATPFEAACWGVINQRVPRAVARSMKTALVRRAGAMVAVDGLEEWAFPEASRVVDLGEDELLHLLRNERKAKAVMAVARAFEGVDEKLLREAPLIEVEEWLQAIYGVGEFTTNFVLFRGLGRFRGQPLQDKLLAAAEDVYRRPMSEAEFRRVSASYGEWGGYFALYLWASTFIGLSEAEAA